LGLLKHLHLNPPQMAGFLFAGLAELTYPTWQHFTIYWLDITTLFARALIDLSVDSTCIERGWLWLRESGTHVPRERHLCEVHPRRFRVVRMSAALPSNHAWQTEART
jgi:hypothetical protein